MDSAKYHCRFIEKAPTMNMKKGEMIAIVSKHDIEIANPIPTKSVLLEKILIILKDIEKVCHWLYDWKSPLFCSTVASISLHIESHKIGTESIKISRWSL